MIYHPQLRREIYCPKRVNMNKNQMIASLMVYIGHLKMMTYCYRQPPEVLFALMIGVSDPSFE